MDQFLLSETVGACAAYALALMMLAAIVLTKAMVRHGK